ncbi:hypothetical protein JOD54_000814 [Actinokineospora baliensis]|uniref:hypothetical protein n=1 Tax=Actinokineospora baliensis TaxID=547056 RepID=UPI001959A99A|nr:hypothetical protein [Actinokineospora baliensis]MBM7770610.1 hypothetical protein [Actinokineospora baliensis]
MAVRHFTPPGSRVPAGPPPRARIDWDALADWCAHLRDRFPAEPADRRPVPESAAGSVEPQ